MPRPPRIDFPDAVCHVTSRGNGRPNIFWSDADWTRVVSQLNDNVAAAPVFLYTVVLMGNQCHLLVRTPRTDPSRFILGVTPLCTFDTC